MTRFLPVFSLVEAYVLEFCKHEPLHLVCGVHQICTPLTYHNVDLSLIGAFSNDPLVVRELDVTLLVVSVNSSADKVFTKIQHHVKHCLTELRLALGVEKNSIVLCQSFKTIEKQYSSNFSCLYLLKASLEMWYT